MSNLISVGQRLRTLTKITNTYYQFSLQVSVSPFVVFVLPSDLEQVQA